MTDTDIERLIRYCRERENLTILANRAQAEYDKLRLELEDLRGLRRLHSREFYHQEDARG